MEIWGVVAIVAATLCYCVGTVLSRPLLEAAAPLQVTAAQALVGAVGLIILSAVFEPLSMEALRALAAPAPLASLLFLSVLGTVAAYSIYLRLVRDWGAPRAGLFAFVSPIAALLFGWLLFGEPLGWREAIGSVVMLLAAALATAPTSSEGVNSRKRVDSREAMRRVAPGTQSSRYFKDTRAGRAYRPAPPSSAAG